MQLTKEIIDSFVSYIDLNDIQEFVKTHPELVQEDEEKEQNTSNPKI